MNAITITGNLVDAPERVDFTGGNGRSNMLVNFRMGNNEYVNGESMPNGFFDVTVFGQQAQHVLSLKKGERIIVTGRMQHTIYERPDGSKGGRTKLVANEIGLSMLFDSVAKVAAPVTPAQPPATTTTASEEAPPF